MADTKIMASKELVDKVKELDGSWSGYSQDGAHEIRGFDGNSKITDLPSRSQKTHKEKGLFGDNQAVLSSVENG